MDKKSYALGMSVAQNLLQSGITNLETKDFYEGLVAMLENKEKKMTMDEASKVLTEFFQNIQAEEAEKQAIIAQQMKEEGEQFLKENAKKEGVVELASGLQYKVIKEGNDKKPSATSKVKCHYEGTLISGMKFDSSFDRNVPATFGLNQVIKGWTEGLQLMGEGAEYMLYIPYQLAYGEAGAGGSIPPCATLIFRVQLIAVL